MSISKSTSISVNVLSSDWITSNAIDSFISVKILDTNDGIVKKCLSLILSANAIYLYFWRLLSDTCDIEDDKQSKFISTQWIKWSPKLSNVGLQKKEFQIKCIQWRGQQNIFRACDIKVRRQFLPNIGLGFSLFSGAFFLIINRLLKAWQDESNIWSKISCPLGYFHNKLGTLEKGPLFLRWMQLPRWTQMLDADSTTSQYNWPWIRHFCPFICILEFVLLIYILNSDTTIKCNFISIYSVLGSCECE